MHIYPTTPTHLVQIDSTGVQTPHPLITSNSGATSPYVTYVTEPHLRASALHLNHYTAQSRQRYMEIKAQRGGADDVSVTFEEMVAGAGISYDAKTFEALNARCNTVPDDELWRKKQQMGLTFRGSSRVGEITTESGSGCAEGGGGAGGGTSEDDERKRECDYYGRGCPEEPPLRLPPCALNLEQLTAPSCVVHDDGEGNIIHVWGVEPTTSYSSGSAPSTVNRMSIHTKVDPAQFAGRGAEDKARQVRLAMSFPLEIFHEYCPRCPLRMLVPMDESPDSLSHRLRATIERSGAATGMFNMDVLNGMFADAQVSE